MFLLFGKALAWPFSQIKILPLFRETRRAAKDCRELSALALKKTRNLLQFDRRDFKG
jgi:hypothetical protein